MAEIVAPIVRQFAPDLLLISCGLDASANDPLGRMVLSSRGFRDLTGAALALADECCGGRLVVVHEGGVQPDLCPRLHAAVIEALAGVTAPWLDPALARLQRQRPHREVGLDAARAIAEARDVYRKYWHF